MVDYYIPLTVTRSVESNRIIIFTFINKYGTVPFDYATTHVVDKVEKITKEMRLTVNEDYFIINLSRKLYLEFTDKQPPSVVTMFLLKWPMNQNTLIPLR